MIFFSYKKIIKVLIYDYQTPLKKNGSVKYYHRACAYLGCLSNRVRARRPIPVDRA
jgi:hypothetical protein